MTWRAQRLILIVRGDISMNKRTLAVTCLSFALVFIVLWTSPAIAGSPRDGLVVSASWLVQHIKDPDLVLLHIGDEAEYQAGHIPGARFASMDNVSVSEHSTTGLMLEMPKADDLRQRLEALGISDNSRVIVYFGKEWVSPATRIIFTLDYAGLGNRSSLLDGGQPAWARHGGPPPKEMPPPRNAPLAPVEIQPLLVDAVQLASHITR